MSGLRLYLQAMRPRTLSCAVAPVLVGSALAAAHRSFRLQAALASLFCSVCIQVGTNLINDYADAERGADTAERTGPQRVTQSGLVPARTVKLWAALTFAAALLPGAYLVWLGGWPILAAGLLSLLSGYAYTAGPFPLGYHGLGDLFVLVFFGFVATAGCYYVQAGAPPPEVWIAAVPVGCLATAILAVNNLRDARTDVLAGKRTLAVRLGETAARLEYALLLAASFAAPPALVALGLAGPWALCALLALPLALRPMRLVWRESGRPLNEALGATARLQFVASALFALGLLV